MAKKTKVISAKVSASTKQAIEQVCEMNHITVSDYTARLVEGGTEAKQRDDFEAFAKPGIDMVVRQADPANRHFLRVALCTQFRIHFFRMMDILESVKKTD
jgi:hypothetical protein